MGLGDTVVNTQISEICLQWASQTAGFTNRTFEVGHRDMVSDTNVLVAIGDIVGAPRDALPSSPSGGLCPASVTTVIAAMALLALQLVI